MPCFYRSQLIPRWLSGWGFVSAILIFIGALLGILESDLADFGLVFYAPIAVQEMVMALWLILKGFNPTAILAESVKSDRGVAQRGYSGTD